jgi:hypothetical protein
VEVSLDQAFRAFTDAFGSWWPAEDPSAGRHLADQRPMALRPRPAHASEIEVHFTAHGPDQTTVNLNTGTWSDWWTARRYATGSPVAAAGAPS